MLDHKAIKALAKQIGRPIKSLLALSANNDPFYAGLGHRGVAAEWFSELWEKHGAAGSHIRRIHYRLITSAGVILPNGSVYENTDKDWKFLVDASLNARYLDLIPFDALVDQRNDEPMFFAAAARDPFEVRSVSCDVVSELAYIEEISFPTLPGYAVRGFDTRQKFIVEVWIEKSTQNDWLVPLCKRRGVNLLVGAGEQSETRSRELAQRAADEVVPVVVIYISDFDPGGRSMPKAVARKVEYSLHKMEGLNVNLKLIPLALTPDQVRHYGLPRQPIKDSEGRKDKFERTFGVGATELDALEALHPGELASLLNAELDKFLDRGLASRVLGATQEQTIALRRIEAEVEAEFAEQINELKERHDGIRSDLDDWESDADELWTAITEKLTERMPDLSGAKIPQSGATGKTESFVLFDSRRNYFEQMDFYNQWKEGDND
jgi:hypothetical protein